MIYDISVMLTHILYSFDCPMFHSHQNIFRYFNNIDKSRLCFALFFRTSCVAALRTQNSLRIFWVREQQSDQQFSINITENWAWTAGRRILTVFIIIMNFICARFSKLVYMVGSKSVEWWFVSGVLKLCRCCVVRMFCDAVFTLQTECFGCVFISDILLLTE